MNAWGLTLKLKGTGHDSVGNLGPRMLAFICCWLGFVIWGQGSFRSR